MKAKRFEVQEYMTLFQGEDKTLEHTTVFDTFKEAVAFHADRLRGVHSGEAIFFKPFAAHKDFVEGEHSAYSVGVYAIHPVNEEEFMVWGDEDGEDCELNREIFDL